MTDMTDPRVSEYRTARKIVGTGLSAPIGARERYTKSIPPYVECMAEMTPADSPIARRAMMRALFEAGLPFGVILSAYEATEEEAEYVKAHPPVDEQRAA